tara:strand:- start:43 stop:207 length:165 start_codon:yes stop_codon:yes gene_type:complete
MNYKFFKLPDGTQAEGVIRTTDDGVISTIPFDAENTDYQKYLEWAKTNTTGAAD